MSILKPLLFLLSPVLFLLSCHEVEKVQPIQPNILFILADDHTSQAWGIYDGLLKDYVKNEHIKRLATEGLVLNNAFCTNSICVPSRASIMTGQYSHRNGIYTLSEGLHPDSLNIAKLMQSAGYQTAIIGKWHLKQQPSGFDHFMVLPGQGVYDNPVFKTKEDWQDGNKGGKSYPGFSTDLIGDFSLEWLKHRQPDKPFFLMTHFKATHGPFDYPDRHKALLADIALPEPASLYDFAPSSNGRSFMGQQMEELGRRMVFGTEHPDTYWGTAPGLPFSTAGLDTLAARKKIYQTIVKNFLRSGAAIDDNIGKLLDYLEEAGLAENTVVIYTSDQGYFLGEHGFFDKRLMYEESLRMPFVIRYPKEIAAGKRLDDLILNIDFPLLFADFAGIEAPKSMQGRSFRPNLQGNTPADWRKTMYYRYWLHEAIRPAHFGIRSDRYKLVFFYGQPLGKPGADAQTTSPAWEFYDLQEDPKEMHNAYLDTQYQQIISNMKKALEQHKAELGDGDEAYPIMQQIINRYWE